MLAAGGTLAATALAGCSVLDPMPDGITLAVGPPDTTPTRTPRPEEPASDTPMDPTTDGEQLQDTGDSGRPDRTVVRYRDLTTPEQRLVERGLDGGYRTCEDVPDAAHSLADRMNAEHVYLRYRGDLKGIWLAITDMVFASTTGPPDGECGPF